MKSMTGNLNMNRSLMVAAMVTALFAVSCANPLSGSLTGDTADDSRAVAPSGSSSAALSATEPLIAGKNIDAGILTITRDERNIYVEYAANSNYLIGETHLWIGTSVSDVPQNKQGIVVPGKFSWSRTYSPAVSSAIVTVPITWADSTELFVFAHASLIGATASVAGETAFAGTNVYDSKRWTYYAKYALPALRAKDRQISGRAFFDVNGNGALDADEPGIPGVQVSYSGGSETGSTVTASAGEYRFTGLSYRVYSVSASVVTGLTRTTPASVDIDASGNPSNANFGYALDMSWFAGQSANGYTIGFWKTNIDKAIAGTTKGTQIDAATLGSYVSRLSLFALEPLNPPDLASASAILSATGSDPSLLLAKQLMGSELNFANGAFFGGLELQTYLFVYRCEYILKHAGGYSAADILAAKDIFDAYNNTHGGVMAL